MAVVLTNLANVTFQSGCFPSVMKHGGDRLWNRAFLHISHLCDVDLWSRHMAYHHVTLINLYLHTKFHPNRRTFLRTDGGMYERTTIETCLLGQLRGKANNPKHSKTKLLCFSRLLWHSARKRDVLILQRPCAHTKHNKYIKKHNNWMRQCNSQENELILRTD